MNAIHNPIPRLIEHARASLETHRLFWLVWALFVAMRLLAVPLLAPGGYVTGQGPDHLYHLDFVRLSLAGYYPYLNFWMEYPPLFPWLATGAYRLGLGLPPWDNPLLGFNTILHWIMALFEAGNLGLLYAIALRLRDQREAESIAVAYALLFVPLIVFLGWFDALALFFLLLSVWGVVNRWPIPAGLGVGLGLLVKPFAVVPAPAALQAFRRWPRWVIFAGVTLLAAGAVLIPLALLSPDYTLATARALGGNAPWETVWALLDGVVDFGRVAPLAARIDPASSGGAFESRLPWPIITLACGGLGLWLWMRPINWSDPLRSTAFVGLTLGLMLLYSKGYSPQWALYQVALALLILPIGRGVAYGLLFGFLLAAEWPLAYFVLVNAPEFAVAVIVLRALLTLALTVDFAGEVFPQAPALQRARRYSLTVAAEIIVIAGLILTPAALRAYRRVRLEAEPLRPFVEQVEANTGQAQLIVSPQPDLIERVWPFVRRDADARLFPNVEGEQWASVDPWMESTARYERVWLAYTPDDPKTGDLGHRLAAWLDAQRCLTSLDAYGEVEVRGYAPMPPSGECPPAPERP
jgi:hypothetical protein